MMLPCYHEVKRLVEVELHLNISVGSIKNILDRFKRNKCLCDKRKSNSGRRKSSTSDAKANEVVNSVAADPNTSISLRAESLNMSYCTVQSVLKRLEYIPYKQLEGKKLSPADKVKRLNFCMRILDSNLDLNKIFLSEEKRFYLCRPKNHQNNRQWSLTRRLAS